MTLQRPARAGPLRLPRPRRRRLRSRAAAHGGALLLRRGGALPLRPSDGLPPPPDDAPIRHAPCGGALPRRRGAWRRRRRAGDLRLRARSRLRARGGVLPSRRSTARSARTRRDRSAEPAASALPHGGAAAHRRGAGFGLNSATAAGSGFSPGLQNLRFLVSTTTDFVRPCEKFCRTVPCSTPAGFSVSVFFGIDAQRLVVTGFRIAHSISSAAPSSSATAAIIA